MQQGLLQHINSSMKSTWHSKVTALVEDTAAGIQKTMVTATRLHRTPWVGTIMVLITAKTAMVNLLTKLNT